ncbi:MAG: hypothetical protein J5958_03540 [Clostridia bacterium]|nr:hypothetical protein [Clostridia bacterium]
MKKSVRFLSLALVALMILPILSALPVKVRATEPALGYNKTYAAASDGELLYRANFSGTSGVWSPKGGWDGMDAAVAPDGNSVALKPVVKEENPENKCCWGNALNDTNYTAIGCSYTVTFTLEGSDDDQYIGFYPEWHTGFVFKPGQKKVSIGSEGSRTGVAGERSYTARTSGAQTYAVEFAVSNTKNGNYYVCTDYRLYVKDGSQWKMIWNLNESQRGNMKWSDADPEMVLRFFRSPTSSGQRSGTVTVSDLNVYKGLIVPSAVAYADAEDGDLLYHADFNGTAGVWSPDYSAWNGRMSRTVTSNGQGVTLEPRTGGDDSRGCVFRGELDTSNYRANGASYTVTFTLSGSDDSQYVGFYPDWCSGFVITPGQKKVSVGKNLKDQEPDLTAIAGEETYTGCGDGAQTYAVEFAVDNAYNCTTYKLYVRDGGQWKPIRELNESQRSQLNWSEGDYEVVLAFFRNPVDGQLNQTVTVSDLNVYKGLCASPATAYEDAGNRDLLYHADFRGTDGVWAPKSSWDGMSTTVAADGGSITLKPNRIFGNNGRSSWGGALDPDTYTAVGSSYTVTFTLEASDDDQFVGFYPDWFSGFVFTPGQKKVSLGQWGNKNLSDGTGNVFYTGGGSGAQTYAVEFAVSDRKNGDFYVCTTYRLYVWDAGQWKPICELNNNQRKIMQWSDTDPEVALRFFRSYTEDGQSGTVTVRDLNVYRGFCAQSLIWTATGAAVRLDNPTGLRFTGYVDKDYLDGLKAEYGAANVKIGMLITPTDYLTDNGLAFTKEELDGCGALPEGKKYVKIEASTVLDDGDAYRINCVLSNVKEANYSRRFSAITYVEIGGSTYYYSRYDEALNARSISYVAELALLDLSDSQEYEYQKPVDGKYSPYTSAQRTTLSGFCRSVTVMTYNVEVYGHGGSAWDGRDPGKSMEIILDVSPDILGLQEVDSHLYSKITTLTNNGYTRIQGDTTRGSWPELYYKSARFTKLNSGFKRYSNLQTTYSGVPKNGADPNRDEEGRTFVWAQLRDETTGKVILAISTHLHYRKPGDITGATDENAAVRRYEIRLLRAWIADQTDYDAIVIVGDMNDDYLGREGGRGRTTIDEYRNGGFEITRDYAAVQGDVGGTLNGTGENELKRSLRQEYVYDYILTEKGASTTYFTVVDQKIDNGGTTYPSDHLPIMAKIVFD